MSGPLEIPIEPLSVAGRIDRLRAALAGAEADALLVTTMANLRYLTGFTGSAALLLVTGDEAVLTTDGRYRTQAAGQLERAGARHVELVVGSATAQREAVKGVLTRAMRLGLEADAISWAAARRWAELSSGVEVVPTAALVEGLRMVKDDGEIERMARAAHIADAALGEVLPMLGEGRTEREVALALDAAMRRRGAEDRAFETIVASGPNSAMPHARPTTRRVERGDAVVVDFGAVYDGYRSDMTRTFCIGGGPAGEMARIFSVVADAQAAGVAAVVAGACTGDVDAVCRNKIADAGFGEKFEHGTGHGVGLDIHEAPAVSPGATAILAAGVVVTVEPGIYVAGVGGVRIEDTVVVSADGRRVLTEFPKETAA